MRPSTSSGCIYRFATVSATKIKFSVVTTPITNQATPIVARLVGTRCIRSGSEAMRTSGTSAKGIPKDKISNRVGSRPYPSKINAGTAVNTRRHRIGIRRRNRPSMITAPA